MRSEDFLRVCGPSEFYLMIARVGFRVFRVYAIRKNANPEITNQCWAYDVTRTIRTLCKLRYCENRQVITVRDSKKIGDAIMAEISNEYIIKTFE